MPRPDAVVIGAGFAGLSAAVALVEHGASVLVVEARPGLGGRATAFTDPETRERVDNGQHVLIGCYHETFAFLRTIGTEGLVDLQDALAVDFIDAEGTRSRLTSAALPPPLHLLGGLFRWPALSWTDRLAALKLGPAMRRAAADLRHGRPLADIDVDETLEAWLVRHGQTARLREMLWNPLAVAALNQEPREVTAAPFVRVLAQMFGGTRRDAALGVPRVPLDELYARPAAEWLTARGSEVRANARARIVFEGSRVAGVETRGDRIEAPIVVSSVPWHAFGELADVWPSALQPTVARASAMASSPIVTVNLWFDRAVTDVALVGLPGRAMQWVFDKRQAFGASASHLSLVSSGASALVSQTNDELRHIAMTEVTEALSRAREARLLRSTVVREKRATFSLAPGQPGRPAQRTEVPGLILAGDWTDTGLPATIESAVVSGRRAADLAAFERP